VSPVVSLVVIAYREADRIEATLRAILAQDGAPSFEVIVVDDGSTDDTGDRVAALAAGEPRLTLVRLPHNVGRGLARATGIAAARGTLIGFVDADITLPTDWLVRCVAALPGHAGVGGIALPDGDAAVVARLTGVTLRPQPGSRAVTGNNVLFDGAVLRSVIFPSTPLGEDFRLVSRLERAGHRFAAVPGLVVLHDERKGYRRALGWLFASGIDATRLFAEFRILRAADLAGFAFAAAVVVAVGASLAGALIGWLLPVAALLAVWAGHVLTRFDPLPSPGRFLAAALLDLPLIGAYLTGRLIGLPALLRGGR
jgi:glycosyltransferase involved in cell wall biosynthesis